MTVKNCKLFDLGVKYQQTSDWKSGSSFRIKLFSPLGVDSLTAKSIFVDNSKRYEVGESVYRALVEVRNQLPSLADAL